MNKRITTAMMLGLILCLFQIENFAQTQPSPTTQHIDTTEEQPTSVEEKEEEEQAMLTVEEQSIRILEAISLKEKKLNSLYKKRNFNLTNDTEELDHQIAELNRLLKDLYIQLSKLATQGYNLTKYVDEPEISIDWRKDLSDVAYPILRELKQITEHARTVERFNIEIEFLKERRTAISSGLENLSSHIEKTTNPKLLTELRRLQKRASSRLEDINQRLSILQYKLNEETEDESTLWQFSKELLRSFASELLLHLIIAVVAAWLTYQVIKLIAKIPQYYLSKSQTHRKIFIERTVNLISSIAAWIAAILMLLSVLYSFGQWALLGIIVATLVALLFSLKDVVPQYLVEVRTLLNLGSVRQGERLVFNDISWKVVKLDVYTRLYNPALNAIIRVPITELTKRCSRPFHSDEPWFPTNTGDFIFTSNHQYGCVIRQTPEIIQVNFAGAIINYKTTEFLSLSPINLSENGFSIFSSFGLDYSLQKTATTEVLEQFEQYITQALENSKWKKYKKQLILEFSSANMSSLDFKLIASFSGEAASNYYAIERWLQKSCVECANHHQWEIPFQQITLHSAS